MPAWEAPGQKLSLVAGADLTNSQFRFLELNASGNVVQADGTGYPVGVLYNRPAQGQAATVVTSGVVQVYSGAAVAIGDRVVPDATGRAVTAGGTVNGFGLALTSASGAGQLISVLLLLHTAV